MSEENFQERVREVYPQASRVYIDGMYQIVSHRGFGGVFLSKECRDPENAWAHASDQIKKGERAESDDRRLNWDFGPVIDGKAVSIHDVAIGLDGVPRVITEADRCRIRSSFQSDSVAANL